MHPLSPTAIKTANRCPLAYQLAYTDKVPKAKPTGDQWRGIAVHRALKALALQRMAAQEPDVRAACSPDRNGIATLIGRFVADGGFADLPVAVERNLTGVIAGIRVEARADRIDGDAVVEYKTGGDIADHDRVQAGILATLAGKPCRIVVLESGAREQVDAAAAVTEAVTEAARVRDTNDRTPRPGAHCAKCPVRAHCPAQ